MCTRIEQRTRPCAETKLDRRLTAGIRRRLTAGLALTTAIFAAFVVPNAFATPPPGTPVTNQASGRFDDGSHSSRTARSNTATLTVGAPQTSDDGGPPITLSLAVS